MPDYGKTPDPGPRTSDFGRDSDTEQDLAKILKQVRRIELRTKKMVSNLAAGSYRSAFKGTGLEFDEVREYSEGDDVRHIDWNVTARAGKAFVKVFREERELSIAVLVDCSGSMRFGAIPGVSDRAKQALAAEASAVIAINAMRNRDRIGLVAFSDRTEVHLPVRRGRGHSLRLVREVMASGATPRRADLDHALDELRRVAKRRAVCFLISDFLDVDDRFASALAQAGRTHDLIGLRVADPAEATLPNGSAPLALVDPEGSGEMLVALNDRARRGYAKAYGEHREKVSTAFRSAGCDLVDLTTDQPAVTAITRFFRERRRRVR
jgi:uncharacterized protein (DUF58 family)